MNVEYMELNDKVYVTEENGSVYERENNENIEKILILENRLETLSKTYYKNRNKKWFEVDSKIYNIKEMKQKYKNIIPISLFISVSLVYGVGSIITKMQFDISDCLMFSMLAVVSGELIFFLPIKLMENFFTMKAKGYEGIMTKIEEEKTKIEEELAQLKKVSKKTELNFEDFKKIIEQTDKNIKENDGLFLDEEPYFTDLEDDSDYLNNLNKELELAYIQGIETYTNSQNTKRKVLRKEK